MAPDDLIARELDQVERANASGRVPVVFVHGLWLLPSSWDRWAELFEEAGYAPLTPGWPDDPETVEEANAHPEVFADKTVGQVADHFAAVIARLERKPAVIGHSFGGLLAQILAGRGLLRGGGGHRPGAVPRRAAAALLGAPRGEAGARQPGQPPPGGAADLRRVPLLVRQRGERGGGARAVRHLRGARRRARRSSRPPRPTSTRGRRRRSTRRTPSAARS